MFWSHIYLNCNCHNFHRRFKCRWFHICPRFFSNLTFDDVSWADMVIMSFHFCEHFRIFVKSIECGRGSGPIAFTVHCNAYKHLQHLIIWCWFCNDFLHADHSNHDSTLQQTQSLATSITKPCNKNPKAFFPGFAKPHKPFQDLLKPQKLFLQFAKTLENLASTTQKTKAHKAWKFFSSQPARQPARASQQAGASLPVAAPQ